MRFKNDVSSSSNKEINKKSVLLSAKEIRFISFIFSIVHVSCSAISIHFTPLALVVLAHDLKWNILCLVQV